MGDLHTTPDPDVETEASACLNIFLIFIEHILIKSFLPPSLTSYFLI